MLAVIKNTLRSLLRLESNVLGNFAEDTNPQFIAFSQFGGCTGHSRCTYFFESLAHIRGGEGLMDGFGKNLDGFALHAGRPHDAPPTRHVVIGQTGFDQSGDVG